MPSSCSGSFMTTAESISAPGDQRHQPVAALAYAYDAPPATAVVRQQYEDFRVDERLGFEPDGDGDHVWLLISKSGHNTHWLAAAIARLAGVRERDVGYAGLKDRHALTTQWFSVDMAGRSEPDWQALGSTSVAVLRVERHRRKLRRGTLRGNHFTIRLRDLDGDRAAVAARLEAIKAHGVPNYFGEQRFGHDNIVRAAAMFAGKKRIRHHQRSLYLSAARSLLFNAVLSRRVELGLWNHCVAGDVLQLHGSHSVFKPEHCDAEIERRLDAFDIHPSGPLWGQGGMQSTAEAQAIETAAVAPYENLCRGLEDAGLKQQRRSLRLVVEDFDWRFSATGIELTFYLPAGSYATVVLRELVDYYSRSATAAETA